MNILFSWLSIPRMIGIWIDTIAFSLIDNAYNLIVFFAGKTFFDNDAIKKIMTSTYVIVALFALFRLALLLVNAMITPDNLYDSKKGIGKIGINVVVMFVLLIITPTIFKEARDLQDFVVKENIIGKMFGLGVADFSTYSYSEDADAPSADDEGYNPGKIMQKIVVSALIFPDERLVDEDGLPNEYCSTENCEEIITDYNNMMSKDYYVDFMWLSRKITASVEVEDEEVYVLHYYFIVTLAVAGFIAYILFSFAIDIAVRCVELAALEMLSPLFIVTYIDPKSASSGPFHNWLTTTGKTYVSLFIKLAIVSIMLVLITLMDDPKLKEVFSGGGLMAKVLMLFAILIFAKKAPTWISGMIGIKDSEGLGGLSIGKKLAGAALIGGVAQNALNKGKNAAIGAGIGAVKNAHAARKAKKLGQKEAGERSYQKVRDSYKASRAGDPDRGIPGKGVAKSLFSGVKNGVVNKKEAKDTLKRVGDTAATGAVGFLAGALQGVKDGASGKDIKDINSKTSATAKATLDRYAPGYQSISSKVGEKMDRAASTGSDNRFGGHDAVEDKIYNVQKEKEGMKTAKKMYGDSGVRRTDGGKGKRDTILSPVDRKETNQMVNDINGRLANDADLAAGVASIFGTANFSGTNVEGLSQAFLAQRLKRDLEGNIVGNTANGTYTLDNGSTLQVRANASGELQAVVKDRDANGNEVERLVSFSEYCTRAESGRILTEGGLANFESIAQANAITNADRVINNNQQISNANQQAAAANDQMMTFMNNVKSMGADAERAINNLVRAMNANQMTTNQYNAAMRELGVNIRDMGDEQRRLLSDITRLDSRIADAAAGNPPTDNNGNPIDIAQLQSERAEVEARLETVKAVIAYDALYGEAGAIRQLDSIEGLMPGTAASFMATVNLRDEATDTSRKLTAENEKIKSEIQLDINAYGDKSYYKPEDFDGTHTQDFLESVEKAYVKDRMTAAKEKVDKKKDRLLSDEKDKK